MQECGSRADGARRRAAAASVVIALTGALILPAPAGAQRDGPHAEQSPITPQLAEALYAQLAPLRESDGCRIGLFDTTRYRIDVGVQAPSGAQATLAIAATRAPGPGARQVGDWAVGAAPELAQTCAATLGAIERVLQNLPPPTAVRPTPRPTARPAGSPAPGAVAGAASALFSPAGLILGALTLLVLGSAYILRREWRASPPAPIAIALLAAVWGAGLALRLTVSPQTFLHEYFHIAEMISSNLTGNIVPNYGWTGPVLYRTVAALAGRPADVEMIFRTNAVFASLAIPAVALLDLALAASWPRALCAAVLLAVLPLHLRWAAAEDLFVLGVTFCFWASALFANYLRSGRLIDALCIALALALAMQTRPELLLFPLALVAMALLVAPHPRRVLFARPTLTALAVLVILLLPRLVELYGFIAGASSPPASVRMPGADVLSLVMLADLHVTPPIYLLVLAVGLVRGARTTPRLVLWVAAVSAGYTLLAITLGDNYPFLLREQILPVSLTVLVASGAASAWTAWWPYQPRLGLLVGGIVLLALAASILLSSRQFVGELRDQQREWAFLQRSVPALPARGTLLAAVQVGGRNLDAFPQLLLEQADKRYALVDVRQAAAGEVAWPVDAGGLLYYQGMYCYFAFSNEPPPDPMTAACRAVHERYVAEPLAIEDLDVPGYSQLQYAQPPFRIGFFRLSPRP